MVQAGMSDTTRKNFQITLPRLLLRQLRCSVFYCISWQQLTTEVLCNKNINIIQTTLSLVWPPQKRTCLSCLMQLQSEKQFQKWKQFQCRNKAHGTQISSVSPILPVKSLAGKRLSDVRGFGRRGRFRKLCISS